MFCPGQPGLTCFIKYLCLTWILHRITWVNNDVWWWWCLGWCEHIMSRHFEKSHCWWHRSTKKSNKIVLYGYKWLVQQQPWQSCIARPYDTPGVYQCSIITGDYNWNINKHLAHYMAWVCEITLSIRLIVASSHDQWIHTLICTSSSLFTWLRVDFTIRVFRLFDSFNPFN